jgi:hypothetical protein
MKRIIIIIQIKKEVDKVKKKMEKKNKIIKVEKKKIVYFYYLNYLFRKNKKYLK